MKAALLVAIILLSGCGDTEKAAAPEKAAGPAKADAAEAVPTHGYVRGAEETAEPQARLVLADAGTGAVHVLDLITEKVTAVARVASVEGITGDGRFAYVAHAGESLRVIDSGGWTVDHGDHLHFYRTTPRDVGTVTGRRALSDAAVTAVSGSGGVRLLDRAKLEEGLIAQTATVPGTGTALPYDERLFVPVGGAVAIHSRAGAPAGRIDEPCPQPRGAVVTRRGAVFGCADGALLVGGKGAEKIPHRDERPGELHERPGELNERPGELTGRPGSTVLAAIAGDGGVWVLDVTAKSWKRLETGPVAAVTATGPQAPVLVLTTDGVLHSWDPESGRKLAKTRLLDRADDRVTIQADPNRAYINDPAVKAVHEIDYRDGLRRARTFELDFTPTHMVETGR